MCVTYQHQLEENFFAVIQRRCAELLSSLLIAWRQMLSRIYSSMRWKQWWLNVYVFPSVVFFTDQWYSSVCLYCFPDSCLHIQNSQYLTDVLLKLLRLCAGSHNSHLVYVLYSLPILWSCFFLIIQKMFGHLYFLSKCYVIVHSAMHTRMNRPNSCLFVRFSISVVILCYSSSVLDLAFWDYFML